MAVTVAAGVSATLVLGLTLLVVARLRPHSPWVDRIVRAWSRAWLAPAGVRVSVEGLQHIDADRSYVVVSNHLSTFDIMALFVALPLRLRFLAKHELYRIPVLGPVLRTLGMVEVDRSRPDIEMINSQAAEVLSSGHSIVAFPEGKRSRDGTLGVFKVGAFAIAVANRALVCPVTIEGSRDCWEPGERRISPGRVRVVAGEVIDAAAFDRDEVGRLRDETRQVVETAYQRLLSEAVA